VLNVALPAIQRDLHASVAGLQWTVDAYTLVLACFLMLAGSVADRFGRRRAFQAGLAVFSLGSALCALAPNLGLLIVFRMIQALGGTMLAPVAMSIITRTFVDAQERARAIGAWSAVVGISLACGPPLGGFLVALAGWRSIFWINVPIGLLAIALTRRFVPESRAARPRRLDPVGQVLVTTLLGSLIYGVIELPSQGLSPLVLGLLVVAVAALAAFLVYERRRSEPLIELRFFRSTPFAGATVMAVCALAALGGFLFINTLYLQNVRGLTALQAGLWMLPTAAMTFAFPPVAGRMINAYGPRLPLVLAGTAMALAGLLFAVFHAGTNVALLFTAYVVFGIGFGLAATPISNTAVVGMPRDQAGLAAAVLSTSHQVGPVERRSRHGGRTRRRRRGRRSPDRRAVRRREHTSVGRPRRMWSHCRRPGDRHHDTACPRDRGAPGADLRRATCSLDRREVTPVTPSCQARRAYLRFFIYGTC
jgi:EmrB/QacA subfamily drug resistance transporter